MRISKLILPILLFGACYSWAQDGKIESGDDQHQAPDITVSATRVEQNSFDAPASIDRIDGNTLRQQNWGVNASEALSQVPGVFVQNRASYSQDQQLSIRGYGARSGFGIRGIRIVVDGIPASMPDGQGQTGTLDFATIDRAEILRGPLAGLYGNHAGGLVSVFTKQGGPGFGIDGGYTFGSYDSQLWRLQTDGQHGITDYVLSASRFDTDGFRDHSAAKRDLANFKLSINASTADKVTIAANYLDQPNSQDPLGLTNAQWRANPRQTIAPAIQFDTHRDLTNQQGGVFWQHTFTDMDKMTLGVYYGTRNNKQYLSIPLAAQNAPLASGGVSAIDRNFWGTSAQYAHITSEWNVTVGAELETMDDVRTGYINNNGQQGALKRNEDNDVQGTGGFVQGEWKFLPQWSLVGGLRYSNVSFKVKDRYITATNPDDSGNVAYNSFIPALGLIYHASETVNIYGNIGRGFETPTTVEMAYRSGGSGPNLDLKPANSNSAELGVKAILPSDTRINVAVFSIRTHDDLVVASAANGRTVYGNRQTKRDGFELSITSEPRDDVGLFASTTWMNGKFSDGEQTFLPGSPRFDIYAEAQWKYVPLGFMASANVQSYGKVYVDDANSADPAPIYTLLGFSLSFTQKFHGWSLSQFVRGNNLTDKNFVSGVVLNDQNNRFYYPGNGRNWLAGLTAGYRF